MNELMQLNNKASNTVYGKNYKHTTVEQKEVINGFIKNYLYLIRMRDEGVTTEHDPTVWDECARTEKSRGY